MSYDIEKVTVPRLARLVKGSKGYGFNLHGDKTQPGQTISAVDKDSPAEIGGLREGDRVIEVNGTNVETAKHGDVVKLITNNPNETSLLVCDRDTLAYLKANDRQCTADMVNLSTVVPSEVPEQPQPIANGSATTHVVQEKIEESAPAAVEESAPPPPEPVTKVEDAVADTTPEEVKQLNNVLDEEEKPAEQPEPPVNQVEEPPPPKVEEPPPKAEEPPAPQVEEPAKPSEPEQPAKPVDSSGLNFGSMASARPSKKRNVKSTGETWGTKIKMADGL